MSRSRSSSILLGRRALLLATPVLALLLATPAGADPRIEVAGGVEPAEGLLAVRVDLANRGDAPAAALHVSGELLGHEDAASLASELAPGAARSVRLRFPAEPPRPGLYALVLLIEYTLPSGAAASQRAYLLLALGARPEPAVRLSVPELRLGDMGSLVVGLASADGRAHTVRLRVFAPKGLRVEEPGRPVEVSSWGRTTAEVTLFRGSAPWGLPQGILVVASSSDGALERAAVATGLVRIRADPALMPRLRPGLVAAALVLLLGASAAELRRFRAGA